MNVDSQLVEQIVSGVLERLGTPDVRERADAEEQHSDRPNRPARFDEPVVTADVLEQRLNGARDVVFGPKTVLTPSAHELLARQNVNWSRDVSGRPAMPSTQTWLAIVVQSTPAVQTALEDTAPAWRRELVGKPAEAARLAVSAICRGNASGAVAFSAEPHALVCLANRNSRLRGAAVDDASTVRIVMQQMGANLLAVDPAGKSYIELRNILRTCTAGGVPATPSGWSETA